MDIRLRYIELLKHCLIDMLGPATTRAVTQPSGDVLIEDVPEAERSERLIGRDWPANGTTMIGLARLTHLQRCIETVLAEEVPPT
jgi:O-methyltransferase